MQESSNKYAQCATQPLSGHGETACGHAMADGTNGNCALGVPVVSSYTATALPTDSEGLMLAAISLIQEDNYHGLLALGRYRLVDVFKESRRCGFVLRLKTLQGIHYPQGKLQMKGATLLHYAVGVASFRAAAALLLINPRFLGKTFKVHVGDVATAPARVNTWTAHELALFLCDIYECEDMNTSGEAREGCFELDMGTMYKKAATLLKVSEEHPEKLPFIRLTTVDERISAAGHDADAVLDAFLASAETAEAVRCMPEICGSKRLESTNHLTVHLR